MVLCPLPQKQGAFFYVLEEYSILIFVLVFLSMAIGAAGFAWKWSLAFNNCNIIESEIARLSDNRHTLLLIYGLFSEKGLGHERRAGFRKYIDLNEPTLKVYIETFKDTCRSKAQKSKLTHILKEYELYLVTKQGFFKENQQREFLWIRKNFPYELVYDQEEL